ncbi:hypothetical protein PC116_g3684 [Phytophthora cactorum]|nr:hypothetical protein PC114_g3426 [Phytophthora cactorum]KAG3186825.1 hypothetical protein C6341_g3590 [Phytophthora cactorum]KAG4248583.1 hypothetical protein PC116_g3684 [Phytophthora cactorum]
MEYSEREWVHPDGAKILAADGAVGRMKVEILEAFKRFKLVLEPPTQSHSGRSQ